MACSWFLVVIVPLMASLTGSLSLAMRLEFPGSGSRRFLERPYGFLQMLGKDVALWYLPGFSNTEIASMQASCGLR